MRFVVARLADFPPETRRVVRVDGREIGVFRIGDRFYAVRNRCPHQGAPLCEGRIASRVSSERPGHVRQEDGKLLVCPWHGWRYDMVTGEPHARGDPGPRTYGVSVERARLDDGALEVPGFVETFAVSVEDDYVVLEAVG